MINFGYIGLDGKYALVRVKFKTEKVSGELPFADNVVDTIQIFRKENKEWKFWTQAILEIEYVE